MPSEISDKLYIIVEDAKKTTYKNAILFADALVKRRLEEFSYVRSGKIQYCDVNTVREYISFAKDIDVLKDDLTAPKGLSYRSKTGFETWLGDVILTYLDSNKLSMATLKDHALKLIDDKTLPTTEKLFEIASADIAGKHFRWSLTVLQAVKPKLMGVCRKWVWVPSEILKY